MKDSSYSNSVATIGLGIAILGVVVAVATHEVRCLLKLDDHCKCYLGFLYGKKEVLPSPTPESPSSYPGVYGTSQGQTSYPVPPQQPQQDDRYRDVYGESQRQYGYSNPYPQPLQPSQPSEQNSYPGVYGQSQRQN